MKQFLSKFILCFLLSGLTFALGNKEGVVEERPLTLRAAALVGPSGIGMAYLFSNRPDLGEGVISEFEAIGSVDALLPKLINGDLDIGILPPNIAAKIYNIDKKSLVVGAIVGNSMLTLITRDTTLTKLEDLEGKTVSVIGQGATPEFVLRTLLLKEGLIPESVQLDYSIPATEIVPALLGNKISYAFVPEPFATIAVLNSSTSENPIRRALFARDYWKANDLGDDFPMTLCVIRKEFAESNPAIVLKFLDAYRKSIAWTVANPDEAGKLAENAGMGLKAAIVARAIPSSNYIFLSAAEGRASIEQLLSVFLDFAPSSIGGHIPDDGFYLK